jgi:hypothetical protein
MLAVKNILKQSDSPKDFKLNQNFPNPFYKRTKIKYSLPQKSKVMIMFNNDIGHVIEKLILINQEPGEYEMEFYADGLPKGTYFYHVIAGNFFDSREMELTKFKTPPTA